MVVSYNSRWWHSLSAAWKFERDYGPCDYDIRHNLNAQYVYELPFKFTESVSRLRPQWLANLWNRLLA